MAIDPNDPEVKESLKYLVLPTEEKLKLRSAPFDAKKAVWIPDAKEVYVSGEIVEVKGEQTVVQTAKGEVRIHFRKTNKQTHTHKIFYFRMLQLKPNLFNK